MVAIEPVSIQIGNFLMTVFCGLIMGFLFDVYRVLRGKINPKTLFADLGDLFFWVVTTLMVFALLLLVNWGEVRLYVFLGLLIGLFSYFKLLSRTVNYLLSKVWRVCMMLGSWAAQMIDTLIWRPGTRIMGMLAWPCLWMSRKFCRLLSNASCITVRYKDGLLKRWLSPKDPPKTPKE